MRANEAALGATAEEILRLREENDDLRSQLAAISLAPPEKADRLASGPDPVEVRFQFTRKVRNEKHTAW